MKVREEIEHNAAERDKPALRWLLDRYSMRSQWGFVARCTFRRYGRYSYQVQRVWTPTPEGWVLYNSDDNRYQLEPEQL